MHQYPEYLRKYIPPEFDLTKYGLAANMELPDWFENLWVRLGYQTIRMTLDEEQKEAISILNKANISRGILIDGPYYRLMSLTFQFDQTTQTSVVRDISYMDLFHKSDLLMTDELAKLYSEVNSFVTPMLDHARFEKLTSPVRLNGSMNENSLSWLEVDLDCSDKEIVNAFSSWLQSSRHQLKVEKKLKRREHQLKKLNKVSFRKWHDEKVLAYIDLAMWNTINETGATNKIYGEILFNDPKDLRDKTKKIEDTVKHYARELTSPDFLRRVFKLLSDQGRQKNS